MRAIRTIQLSIFDFFAKHKVGLFLEALSQELDKHPQLLELAGKDLAPSAVEVGRKGLTVESIFRCMILKQFLKVSYAQLSFHLCDSQSYRSFARIEYDKAPGKSALQENIRRLQPETLTLIFDCLAKNGYESGELDPELIRIDSTVVKSDIAPPSDSNLLNDGIRVISRLLAKSGKITGIKIRFKDFRKPSKSLSYRIFLAKKAEKDELYSELLDMACKVIDQAERAILKIEGHQEAFETSYWLEEVAHYRQLLLQVIDQTQRRVIDQEKVPSREKLVSLFETHTDIIVKGKRGVEYGHKINIASDKKGLLTHISIEEGNAADVERFLPILEAHQKRFDVTPSTTICDGCYASLENVEQGKTQGVKKVVFHKKNGLGLRVMGVKQKTFEVLKNFRAGIEGNVSELKRAFGMDKARWKGEEGFHAYVLASAITYNLVRLTRMNPG